MTTTLQPQSVRPVRRAPWTECTDEQLLMRYRDEGDRGAFEALVHRYEKELYSYLCRYLGDATMAEDVFQQTFLQLHLKCDKFETGRRVRPWLYTIATHQAIDAQRRDKRHRMVSLDRRGSNKSEEISSLVDLLTSNDETPAGLAESRERRDLVRKVIADLPEPLRVAVMLIYYQGLKYREAAEVLDVPVGTVKSRLHTAVQKLTEAWNRAVPSGDE